MYTYTHTHTHTHTHTALSPGMHRQTVYALNLSEIKSSTSVGVLYTLILSLKLSLRVQPNLYLEENLSMQPLYVDFILLCMCI
jgi:hypothetical protein